MYSSLYQDIYFYLFPIFFSIILYIFLHFCDSVKAEAHIAKYFDIWNVGKKTHMDHILRVCV